MVHEGEQLAMSFIADPDQEVPSKPAIRRFIRLREVLHRTGLGRSTIYRWMNEGRFPRSVHLGGRSVAWIEHEIDQWLQDQCR